MLSRFEGKVVVVSCAGSDIGAAIVRRFHAGGASVVLCGRTEAALAKVANTLGGDRYLIHQADLTVAKDVERLVSEAEHRFRRVDVLVNNAATSSLAEFLTQTRLLADAILPLMVGAQRAAIVNAPTLGSLDGWGLTFYSALSIVSSITRGMATELGPKGIRVNAVAPSITDAELSALRLEEVPKMLRRQLDRIPLGRGALPQEIASAIAFLASGDASFVNGVNLPVDGGLSALVEFSLLTQ